MQRSVAWSLALASCTLLDGNVEAASFDYEQAQPPAERSICGDDSLGRLDEQTAGLYVLMVGIGGPSGAIGTVNTTQNALLMSRNACGSQPDCLVDAYTARMMLLKHIKDDPGH